MRTPRHFHRARPTQGHETSKDLSVATDLLHLAAKAITDVFPNNAMASKDLADAKEHIASIGNILERAIVAQTLGSITELKVDSAVGDPAGGSSSSSTQMSPSLTTAPQLITERPLGLQELHNELGAIGHAATHTH